MFFTKDRWFFAMAVIAVVGGGISGLSTAYYLMKHGGTKLQKVLLLEATDHLGGWIKSTRFPDGTVYEQGPRSIRPVGEAGKNTLAMVEDLQLQSEIITIARGHPVTKNRLLLVNDQLHPLPSGLSAVFKITPPFSRPLILYALKDLIKKQMVLKDDSMYNFAERRFGKEIAELLIDPLCRGVYAGDAREISVKALMKVAFEAEQKYGSVLKGILREKRGQGGKSDHTTGSQLIERAIKERWALWNFRSGLQTLPKTLSERLTEIGVHILKNTPCTSVKLHNSSIAEIQDGNGSVIQCNHVMASVPASKLASLFDDQHPELSGRLASIPTVTCAVTTLEFEGSPQNLLKQQAFGFLVPSCQPYPILGITFDSCCFREHDGANEHTRLTVMMGGRWFERLFGNPNSVSSEDLLQIALDAVRRHLGITADPVRSQVVINKNCIPQYTVGHFERLNNMRTYIKQHSLPLSLIGASYDGVGINDCIFSAKRQVEEYLLVEERTTL